MKLHKSSLSFRATEDQFEDWLEMEQGVGVHLVGSQTKLSAEPRCVVKDVPAHCQRAGSTGGLRDCPPVLL